MTLVLDQTPTTHPDQPRYRLDQSQTPLADAIDAHAARDLVRVHVPGHGADGASARMTRFFGIDVLRKDIPPLTPGVNIGLGNPLSQAIDLAADAWGARRAWFLTNGASQGNRVAVLALAGLGSRIVAQRSTHSSFVDGLIFSGLTPEYVMPNIDEKRGIAHGVPAHRLAEALRRPTDGVAAVYVISPSYFGAVADIAELAQLAHAAGLPLVVDAAWGAHFGFSPLVPENPLRQGADLVISSTHKLGGSLTQSAMLHLAEGPFADALEPLIDRAMKITQSTSENSYLLASLDLARHSLVHGEDRIRRSFDAVERLRADVLADPVFELVDPSFAAFDDIVGRDPLRVVIDVTDTGVSAFDLSDAVAEHDGVHFELTSQTAVVALVGAGSEPDLDRILPSMHAAARDIRKARGAFTPLDIVDLPEPAPARLTPREAYFSQSELVPAADAVGRVSADTLAAYPPGIPNVLPGEEITAETVAFLQRVAASQGGYVRGAADPASATFRVVR